MKLHYCKYPDGSEYRNFGDALNPWLWEQLMPGIFDEDERIFFIGIGTLINDALPRRTHRGRKRIIFSTGVGYEKGVPKIDDSYKIYCLRGPLSANKLGLSQKLAIVDGAVLLRRIIDYDSQKIYRFSYMPHYNFAGKNWQSVCEELGFGYIDPAWSIHQIISCISQTEILLTEAMHGAIVADAFRVPWIPIVTHPSILAFKWQDWCSSVGVEYQPIQINRLHQPRKKLDIFTPVRTTQNWFRQKLAQSEIVRVVKTASPIISKDAMIERLTVQLEEKLDEFKNDVKSGLFLS